MTPLIEKGGLIRLSIDFKLRVRVQRLLNELTVGWIEGNLFNRRISFRTRAGTLPINLSVAGFF